MGTMSFIRCKPRKLASGEIRKYYYEVENYWVNGKVKQRVKKYLGTSPFPTEFEIDPDLGGQVARTLFDKHLTPSQIKKRLKTIGIPLPPGELKEVSLVYNPPQRKLLIRISCI